MSDTVSPSGPGTGGESQTGHEKSLAEITDIAGARNVIAAGDIPTHSIVEIELATWPYVAHYIDLDDLDPPEDEDDIVPRPVHRRLVLRSLGYTPQVNGHGFKLLGDERAGEHRPAKRNRLHVNQVLALGTFSLIGKTAQHEPNLRLMESLSVTLGPRETKVVTARREGFWPRRSKVLVVSSVEIDDENIMTIK